MRSTNSFGDVSASRAVRSIFRPCSSVPVRKNTSSPARRCQRASASATIVVYACPRWGLALT
jgi:hypothetical protein